MECTVSLIAGVHILSLVLPSQPRGAGSEVSTALCVYYLQPRMHLCDAAAAAAAAGVSTDTTECLVLQARGPGGVYKKIMAGSERV